MTRKKWFLIASALVALGVLLAAMGCGQQATATPAPAATEAAPAATTAPAAAPTATTSPAASAGAATLKFWTLQQADSNIAQAQEAAVREFEAANNAKVELVTYPYVELRDKLLLAASSGAAPDVMLLDQIWVAQYAGAGYIAPIDELMKGVNIKKGDYFPGAWDSGFYKGKQYTVPFDVGVWGMLYYNKDMFKAAGLDPEKPPTTWDELVAAAKQLTKSPDQWGIPVFLSQGDAGNCMIDAFIFSSGGQVLDATTNKAALNGPAGVKALEFMKSLLPYGPPGAVGRSEEDALTLFTSGKAAMDWYGEWGQDTIKTRAPNLNYGVALLPRPTDGKSIGTFGGFNMGISSKSDKKDLAWKFIQYASSYQKQLEITMLTPAQQQAAKEYLQQRRQYPDVIFQQLQSALFRPLIPNYPDFAQIQSTAAQKALLDQATPQQALDEAAEKMNKILQ